MKRLRRIQKMSNEGHVVICGCVELLFGLIYLIKDVYPACVLMLGMSAITIIIGIILERRRKK